MVYTYYWEASSSASYAAAAPRLTINWWRRQTLKLFPNDRCWLWRQTLKKNWRTRLWFVLVDNDASLAVVVVDGRFGHCSSMMSLTTVTVVVVTVVVQLVAATVAPPSLIHSVLSLQTAAACENTTYRPTARTAVDCVLVGCWNHGLDLWLLLLPLRCFSKHRKRETSPR